MVGPEAQKRLAGKLTAAESRTARTKVVDGYVATWGLTRATIYRHAKAGGWESGRRQRADDGGIATPELTQEHFQTVANYLTDKRRRRKKPPVEKAILSCVQAGAIPAGRMTPSKF